MAGWRGPACRAGRRRERLNSLSPQERGEVRTLVAVAVPPRWQPHGFFARCSNMSKKLEQLWHEQGGRCLYCDGPTYLPSSENKDQARRRLIIEPGSAGAAKLLNHHTATVDRASAKMACKF